MRSGSLRATPPVCERVMHGSCCLLEPSFLSPSASGLLLPPSLHPCAPGEEPTSTCSEPAQRGAGACQGHSTGGLQLLDRTQDFCDTDIALLQDTPPGAEGVSAGARHPEGPVETRQAAVSLGWKLSFLISKMGVVPFWPDGVCVCECVRCWAWDTCRVQFLTWVPTCISKLGVPRSSPGHAGLTLLCCTLRWALGSQTPPLSVSCLDSVTSSNGCYLWPAAHLPWALPGATAGRLFAPVDLFSAPVGCPMGSRLLPPAESS